MSPPQKCEKCKKRVATVHLTELADDQKREVHLCAECAAEQGIMVPTPAGIELLAGMVNQQISQELAALASQRCERCGHTFLAFRTQGRLGCPHDYEAFAKGLMPLIERMQGATEHVGKVPVSADAAARRSSELTQLRRLLRQAVDREDFERAAQLRDQIERKERDREP
jgi:protein arginine kinase activator